MRWQESEYLPCDQSRRPTYSQTFATCRALLFLKTTESLARLVWPSECTHLAKKTLAPTITAVFSFVNRSRKETASPTALIASHLCRVCFITSCLPEEAWLLSLMQFVRHVFRRCVCCFVSNPALYRPAWVCRHAKLKCPFSSPAFLSLIIITLSYSGGQACIIIDSNQYYWWHKMFRGTD